jgi:uroporphyrinogen decarboxylase
LSTIREAAAEVTLQPIRRFGFDGAILFSDILVVPHALGQHLWFEAGEGPRLAPPLVDQRAGKSSTAAPLSGSNPVYATVARVAAALPPETTFLGFAGSPWTVATYMVAGTGVSRDQSRGAAHCVSAILRAFQAIIDAIVELSIDLSGKAGRKWRRRGAIVRQLGREH